MLQMRFQTCEAPDVISFTVGTMERTLDFQAVIQQIKRIVMVSLYLVGKSIPGKSSAGEREIDNTASKDLVLCERSLIAGM